MLCQLLAATSGRRSPDTSGVSPTVVEGLAPHLHPERRGGALAAALAPFLLPSGCFLSLPPPGLVGSPLASPSCCSGADPTLRPLPPFPEPSSGGSASGLRLAGLPLLDLQVDLLPTLSPAPACRSGGILKSALVVITVISNFCPEDFYLFFLR